MSLELTCKFLYDVKEVKLAIQVLHVFGQYACTFEQFDEVSKNFFKIKEYHEAAVYGEKAYALATEPQHQYVIRANLINVYNHYNEPEKALEYIALNEKQLVHDTDRDFEKAFSLFLMNKKQDAADLLRCKYFDDVTLTEEQRIKVEFNLGTYDLLDGNLQQGLRRFLLAGEKLGIHNTFINQRHDNYNLPRWNGVLKPGLKLVVIAEAGIGDEIINVRFMKELIEYGIDPIWLTLKNRNDLALIYLLNNIPAYSDINQIPDEFINGCCYIPSMQLPIFLNSAYKDLWKGPYITELDETYQKQWKFNLSDNYTEGKPKLKIGLRWQGNPSYDQDLHRSIPLKEIIEAIPISHSRLYSIQRDNGLDELFDYIGYVIDLSSRLKTLQDLFSCINNLDLIITSCTSIAHIAAAMGKEVCVIVPISCYYVWCNTSDTTPWYGDNVHIFYQQKPRTWDEPLNKLNQYLLSKYN